RPRPERPTAGLPDRPGPHTVGETCPRRYKGSLLDFFGDAGRLFPQRERGPVGSHPRACPPACRSTVHYRGSRLPQVRSGTEPIGSPNPGTSSVSRLSTMAELAVSEI